MKDASMTMDKHTNFGKIQIVANLSSKMYFKMSSTKYVEDSTCRLTYASWDGRWPAIDIVTPCYITVVSWIIRALLFLDQNLVPCHWHAAPDSKVHGANMGPIWGRQDPGVPHVGHMNFVIWVHYYITVYPTGIWHHANLFHRYFHLLCV